MKKNLEAFYPNGTKLGEWDDLEFPIREIVEFDGETLFATEDGVARYDESSEQWLSEWTPGNGLPNSADDTVYELWTNGTDLVVGTARSQGWQGIDGEILHLDRVAPGHLGMVALTVYQMATQLEWKCVEDCSTFL